MELSESWPLNVCLVVCAELASLCALCKCFPPSMLHSEQASLMKRGLAFHQKKKKKYVAQCTLIHWREIEYIATHSATVFATSHDGISSMMPCVTARTSTLQSEHSVKCGCVWSPLTLRSAWSSASASAWKGVEALLCWYCTCRNPPVWLKYNIPIPAFICCAHPNIPGAEEPHFN